MPNDYTTAWDALGRAIGSTRGISSGNIDDIDHLTTDQQLKAIEITALLSIAQEISSMNPQNTISYVDGKKTNGWGLPAS